jgi:putative transposase
MSRVKLFKDLYRIPSARLQEWDYRRAAGYFVTVGTKNKACFFGEVVEGEVVLSAAGKIVAEEWQNTPRVRPYLALDEWQIMPNHLHAILIIRDVETPRWGVSPTETFHRNVSTSVRPLLKSHSLGSIIGQFKSVCTKRIWAAGSRDFAWQTRFYDHVIRDPASLEKIRDYIRHNPLMWATDRDNPENLCM